MEHKEMGHAGPTDWFSQPSSAKGGGPAEEEECLGDSLWLGRDQAPAAQAPPHAVWDKCDNGCEWQLTIFSKYDCCPKLQQGIQSHIESRL